MLYNLVNKILISINREGATDASTRFHRKGVSINIKDEDKYVRLRLYDVKKVIITVYLNGYDNYNFRYFADIHNDPTNNYPYHRALHTINPNVLPFKNISVILRTAYTFNNNNEVDDMKGMIDEIYNAVDFAREIEESALANHLLNLIDDNKSKENQENNSEGETTSTNLAEQIAENKPVEKQEENKTESKYYDINTARETIIKTKDFLESKMVGQDEYIKNVCYLLMQILTGKDVETSFFIGKSGSGKTYAWELLCRHNESPLKDILGYELIDASVLTAEGYKGCNLSQTLTNFDQKKNMKKFFVFIVDEFDKLLIKKDPRDWDMELQQSFLQILSHGELRIENDNTVSNYDKKISFEDVPIVLLGAFQNYDFQTKMPEKRTIGFLETEECKDLNNDSNESISEELLKMGAMPELVGRITHFHLLNVLGEDVLRDKLKKDMYEMAAKIKEDYNVILEINSDIPKLIKIERDFGARSIKNCLNKIFDASLMYDVSVAGKDSIISLDDDNKIIHWEI